MWSKATRQEYIQLLKWINLKITAIDLTDSYLIYFTKLLQDNFKEIKSNLNSSILIDILKIIFIC